MLVAWFYGHLVIALLQVNLREDLRASKPIQDVIYAWNGVAVYNSVAVKPPVVHAHPQGTILLPREEDGVSILAGRRTDPALG